MNTLYNGMASWKGVSLPNIYLSIDTITITPTEGKASIALYPDLANGKSRTNCFGTEDISFPHVVGTDVVIEATTALTTKFTGLTIIP